MRQPSNAKLTVTPWTGQEQIDSHYDGSFCVIYTGSETQPLGPSVGSLWRSPGVGDLREDVYPHCYGSIWSPGPRWNTKRGSRVSKLSLLELGHPLFLTINLYTPGVTSWHRCRGHIALQPPYSHWLFPKPPA